MRNQDILNIVVAITIILSACTPILFLTPIPSYPVSLTGAGASFPAPLYITWFNEFTKKYPNVQINYQTIGSGAAIEEFTKGKVDFGASDYAMTQTAPNLIQSLHILGY